MEWNIFTSALEKGLPIYQQKISSQHYGFQPSWLISLLLVEHLTAVLPERMVGFATEQKKLHNDQGFLHPFSPRLSSIYPRNSADLNPLVQLSFSTQTKPVLQPGCCLLSALYYLCLSSDTLQWDTFSSLQYLFLFAGLSACSLIWICSLSCRSQLRTTHSKLEWKKRKGGDISSAAAEISAVGRTESCHLLFAISSFPTDGVTVCPGPEALAAGHSFPCTARTGQNMQTRQGWEHRSSPLLSTGPGPLCSFLTPNSPKVENLGL